MGLYSTLRISSIKNETADCKTFFLQPVEGPALLYQPGQFLTFVFSKPGGEQRRSYSISSAPGLQEPLSITIKRLDNGEYSRQLVDRAQVGDLLTTTGATGFFVLPPNLQAYQQVFFMAAGSGITAVLPLIKTLLHFHPQVHVVLIYSNRSVESSIFYAALQELLHHFTGRLVVEFLFSTALHLERARLGKGLLEELLHRHRRVAPAQLLCYTCGPFDYMRMVSITLLENGVPQQHIKKENFSPLLPFTRLQPPDTDPHTIVVELQQTIHRFTARYPQTILQAAKKAGLVLPYSCEAGRCGSCAAECITGKVWMSNNEVLMDDEIASGKILTCTGFAVNGDVWLQFRQ